MKEATEWSESIIGDILGRKAFAMDGDFYGNLYGLYRGDVFKTVSDSIPESEDERSEAVRANSVEYASMPLGDSEGPLTELRAIYLAQFAEFYRQYHDLSPMELADQFERSKALEYVNSWLEIMLEDGFCYSEYVVYQHVAAASA